MVDVTTELERVQAEIRRLETIRDYLQTLSRNGTEPRRRGPRPRGTMTAAKAAEQVLAAHDGPMRTPDLLDAIRAAGAHMKDADGLFKTLSRSDRFEKAGRGLWKLRQL